MTDHICIYEDSSIRENIPCTICESRREAERKTRQTTQATLGGDTVRQLREFAFEHEWQYDRVEIIANLHKAADKIEEQQREIERLREIIKTERNWLVKRDEALEKARAALENAIR